MNEDSQFENRLRRQPVKPIPAEWREEILDAARNATVSIATPRPTPHGLLATLRRYLSPLLRPQPAAWASLAAVWVVIITLNIASHDDSPQARASRAAAVVSPEALQALQQQRLLLAELVDRAETHPMNRAKSLPPGPRSQRREASATV
jgi:hypothetical protein